MHVQYTKVGLPKLLSSKMLYAKVPNNYGQSAKIWPLKFTCYTVGIGQILRHYNVYL